MARLLTDGMLGKLTTYLRMAGHDVEYVHDLEVEDDAEVRQLVEGSGRTLVTRDTDLAEKVDDSVLLESRDVEDQVREVWENGVDPRLTEPSRCSRCNGALKRDDGSGPDDVDESWRCIGCSQVYWRGSHWRDVSERVEDVVDG